MGCTIIENYLKDHGCDKANLTEEMLKHLDECRDCQSYFQFVTALEFQKNSLENAPEELIKAVEMKILDSLQIKQNKLFAFTTFFKPAFAGICIVLFCFVAYIFLTDTKVGYVENLSERFKLAQFENITAGDILYVGNNTTASIRLKSKSKIQIHNNTTVKVCGSQTLSLTRGTVSLQIGDKDLQIVTPSGVLQAKNTSVHIITIPSLDSGIVKTETICLVFKGQLTINSSQNKSTLSQGFKTVINTNGRIVFQQALTSDENTLEKSDEESYPIYAAVESLCDCINFFDRAPEKKADHQQLFGKEVNEKKYKVRVFWKAEKLSGLVIGPDNRNNTICLTKTRRYRG